MGTGLSALQKHALHLAATRPGGYAYDLEVLGTYSFDGEDDGQVWTPLEYFRPGHTDEDVLDHIRNCCMLGNPPFIPERGNTSGNKRRSVSRALVALERRGLIERFWQPVALADIAGSKKRRGIFQLTKLGREVHKQIGSPD
jgi:hypothetical protein